jgi:hypothetical protein
VNDLREFYDLLREAMQDSRFDKYVTDPNLSKAVSFLWRDCLPLIVDKEEFFALLEETLDRFGSAELPAKLFHLGYSVDEQGKAFNDEAIKFNERGYRGK